MAGMDMKVLLESIVGQLQPSDIEELKYILKDSFTEYALGEMQTGGDVTIIFKNGNVLQENRDKLVFLEALQTVRRTDLVVKWEIYNTAESHIIKFKDYGYTFICHMENEDKKGLKKNVAFMPRDNDKEIEIHGGAGEKGIKVFKVVHWKNECENYFNRYFKSSPIIVGPSDSDRIMKTLSFVCYDSESRGFVFKDYDIIKHLGSLGYNKGSLVKNLGSVLSSISYIAYIEQKKAIFICEDVSSKINMYQCSKILSVKVKYFLTLYNKEIQGSGVTVIGLLIAEKLKQEKSVDCSFCHLFSASYKVFESPTTFMDWWKSIEKYEGWWNLLNSVLWDSVKPEKQRKLFDDIAAHILCFMAVQEKGFPTLTDDRSYQFKETYFLYTPQQMEIHFSNAKRIIIQGSYGSGKSLLGLKKLELISKSLGRHEKIIYVNFDHKSKLHFLMEKNAKEYAGILSGKIKRTNGIRDIIKSSSQSIYVCHNNRGENLSTILQETLRLNRSTSETAKINYHLIIEEYDGETLCNNEATKITEIIEGSELIESTIILLAQPIMKTRSCSSGKRSYLRETCMFHKLKNKFKIVKLEEVLRCSGEICTITKCTQNFVQNKDSIFEIKMNTLSMEMQRQPEGEKSDIFSSSVQELNHTEIRTSLISKSTRNELSNFSKAEKSVDRGMDIDQAMEKSKSLHESKTANIKIVSKFVFICEPKQGVDIKGIKPNLVEFSENINLASNVAVISLAVVLKELLGENERLAVLHMIEEKPKILRRAIELLKKLDKTFSYTQDIEEYLQKNKQSNLIFSSNFRTVNGMEFDHVVILVSQLEYYLKYYLPQAISRCTFDLTLILLPKDKMNTGKGFFRNFTNVFSRTGNEKIKETVANMIEEWKRGNLFKQLIVAECKKCGRNRGCYRISEESGNKQILQLHTHSDQYQEYLSHLVDNRELEERALGTGLGALADTKIQNFIKTSITSSISEQGMGPGFNSGDAEIDPTQIKHFHDAADQGDVNEVAALLEAGVPVDSSDDGGNTALMIAAMNNQIDLVHLLVQKRAELNKQGGAGWAPLHFAAQVNATDAIKILVQQGASTNIRTIDGHTPLDLAHRYSSKEAVILLEQR